MKSHRALVVAIMILLMIADALATVPTQLTIQGRLTDAGAVPIPGISSFEFRIFDAQFGGFQIWPASGSESQNILSDSEGLWTASVGRDSALTDIVFTGSERWLQIIVGGTTLPRVRLETSPYAFRVATLDGATGGTVLSKVSIGATNAIPGTDAFAVGTANLVSGTGATVTGGNSNSATGNYSVIGGGTFNEAGASRTVVGGGNNNDAQGEYAFVGGGSHNSATGALSAIVAGGGTSPTDRNLASGVRSFVGGGMQNEATDTGAVVVGGVFNRASDAQATIVGGTSNRISQGLNAFIGAGTDNRINDDASGEAAIVGGDGNLITGHHSFIGAGASNEIGGAYSGIMAGRDHVIGGAYSSILAGQADTVYGSNSAILAGYGAKVNGDYSVAAGRRAKAIHEGAFVWADSTNADFASSAANQFLIRASGGVGVGTNAPTKQLEVLDDTAGGLAFPLKLTNQGTTAGTSTGIIFQVDAGGARGKGALIYERSNTWNRGDFHFLQDPNSGPDNVGLTQKVMTIRNDGNVGIGQSAPNNILTIQQNSTTDPVADAWGIYSSRRWKQDIEPIHEALAKVEQLQGVTYAWKVDGKRDIGLIAEDVSKIIPEVVTFEDNGIEARSVDYARLVALLIEAVKEQQREIEGLRSSLESMKP